MIDRGIIKWQPFNSCINSNEIINDIKNKKDRKEFPILSEDQTLIIEQTINDAFILKIKVNIEYFFDGKINNICGIIKFINFSQKYLYIENRNIYFKQILKINY